MSIEGSLGDFRLQEILQSVAQQRRTGILTIQSETTIVAVSFLAGGVVSVDSLADTVEERLSDALVAQGRLDRQAVDELSRRQDDGEGRLVDLLVAEGLLTRDEVLDALRGQNHSLLLELLDWQEGEFKFYGGDEVAYEEGIEAIAIDDFLLANLDGAAPGREIEDDEIVFAGELESAAEATDAEAGAVSRPAPGGEGAGAAGRTEPRGVRPFGGSLPEPVEPSGEVGPATGPEVGVEPAPAIARRRSVEQPHSTVLAALGGRQVCSLLGLLLAGVLVLAALLTPVTLLAPFPWQEGERAALLEIQRLADRLAVDRAAKTFFLLEGRFPDRLDDLVALGLLGREDRFGPDGRRLELATGPESYDVVAVGEDEPLWSEAISGNFLLDPELRGGSGGISASLEAPLVLLD